PQDIQKKSSGDLNLLPHSGQSLDFLHLLTHKTISIIIRGIKMRNKITYTPTTIEYIGIVTSTLLKYIYVP
ncbi:unnamed protein product, partial [marine sediment metagenome]